MVSGIELVIAIDTSCSMETVFSKFVDSLEDYSSTLEHRNVNFGLITFAESTAGFQIFTHRFNGREFTEKPMKVVEKLRKIDLSDHETETTPSLEALMMTRSLNWPSTTNPRVVMLITDSPPNFTGDDIGRVDTWLEPLKLDGLLIVTDTKNSVPRDQYLALLNSNKNYDQMYDINRPELSVFRRISSMGLETVYYDPFEEERP